MDVFGNEVALFAAVGFLAQLVDGALGMAYGVTSTTVLLGFGVPPAHASAAVHAAEVFTTAASAGSHAYHRNIDWPLFWRLVPAGIAGGVLGAFVLTGIDAQAVRPFVVAYLGLLGLWIVWRAWHGTPTRHVSPRFVAPLGATGGFLDAIGGGGWGPVVTSSLVGAGGAPRQVIGTVNAAEFLLTVSISAAFLAALLTGHWEDAYKLADLGEAVLGLVIGGVLAAPLAGYLVRIVPARTLMAMVGTLVVGLSLWQAWRLL